MFFKRKKQEKDVTTGKTKETKKFNMDYEFLAVPEVHTGNTSGEDNETMEKSENITYDTVAMPEIHMHKKKSISEENGRCK